VNPIYLVAALASVFYGSADFFGGLAARREHAMVVTLAATLAGLPVLAIGLFFFRGHPVATDYAWGVAAGISGGAAAAFIFRALAIGPVSVASPVLALTGMSLPVLVGLLLGERPGPLALAGIGLAVLAIPLLSAHGETEATTAGATSSEESLPRRRVARVLVPALTAGALAGGFLVCVGRIGPGAGLAPLVLARVVSLVLFAGALMIRRAPLWPVAAVRGSALGSGLLDACANTAYFLAVGRGSLALVAALVSLAPATTVLLARAIFGERWSVPQRAGLALALAAGVCISVG
jgi:drug/metabolite transporter (DMT)-like permease